MTAKKLYDTLEPDRSPYMDRADANAQLTLPSLFRHKRRSGFSKLEEPYQSEGAQGVLGLAAKFLLTLLPPGRTFFRLEVNRFALAQRLVAAGMGGEDIDRVKTEAEEALLVVVNEAHGFLDTVPMLRPTSLEHFEHLIVAGNGLLEVLDLEDRAPRVTFHDLGSYVVRRNKEDEVVTLVLRESLDRDAAPERALGLFDANQDTVDIYTVLERSGPGRWDARQEINELVVPGSTGTFTERTSPFVLGRFLPVAGEPYGRGWVEHLYGDLRSLEGLSEALVEAAAAAARIIAFLDPNGGVSARRVSEARNGEILVGRADALTFARVDKQSDLAFALAFEDRLSRRLARAFLRTSAVQRDGERVTAEEIRRLADDLEGTFGGVYAAIAEEFQRPLAERVLYVMERRRLVPALPTDLVRVGVVTGVGSLGRGRDLDDLARAVGAVGQLLGPHAVAGLLDAREGAARILNAVGVDTRGFLKSREELAQEAQAAQQAQLQQAVAPDLVRAVGAQG